MNKEEFIKHFRGLYELFKLSKLDFTLSKFDPDDKIMKFIEANDSEFAESINNLIKSWRLFQILLDKKAAEFGIK